MILHRLEESTTGNCLEVYTNQPCVQLYQGGYLDGSMIGLDGSPILKYTGLCLETQKHPNAINQVPITDIHIPCIDVALLLYLS